MHLLSNLTLRSKLYLSFGAIVTMMLVLAVISLARTAAVSDAVRYQEQVQEETLDPLYVAREALDQTGIAARNAFIFSDEAAAARELDILDQQRALYLLQLDALSKRVGSAAQFNKVKEGMLTMARELDRPRKYREAADLDGFGRFLVNECSPLRRRIVADIDVLLKSHQKEKAEAARKAREQFRSAIAVVSSLTVLAIMLAIAISWALTRGLLRQLGGEPAYATAIANRIAHGELTLEVETRPGDNSSLLYSLRTMRDNLAAIVSQVRSGTDTITTASTEIADGNQDLSKRTEKQAGSLEEVATAMEALTSTVRQNAENAVQADVLAKSASMVSLEGGQVVDNVVQTMSTINAASQKIVDIIGVIDSIAFQTNILALNAAVEAARAGEQGRGFAVVASEVRNLAQRSASAAKEVKRLIGDSVDQVASGTKLVEHAGDTMRKVVESVTRVTYIMAEISSASREQTAGIEQVTNSIRDIDGMTKQNSALVEEASGAAREMEQQAAALAQIVSVFQLESTNVDNRKLVRTSGHLALR